MSDSDSDGPPPPPRQGTGLYRRMTLSSSMSNLQAPKMGFSPTSLNASPMSHQHSFQWEACQSFRLYATQSRSMMASRRGTGHFDMEQSLNAGNELNSAFAALKEYIRLNGTVTVSDSSQLPINIRKGRLIGSGGFAQVYSGINTQTGELVAIKEIKISDTSNRKELEAVEQEFSLLRQLRHPNVVQYIMFEQSVSQKMCRIVMEFMAGGSAQQLLQKFGPLTEAIIKKFSIDMLHALTFIHKEGIIHRDIKPANILVSAHGQVKLADFGCSKRITELTTTGCIIGTPVYMAPEFIRGETTPKCDIWAMGCTLFELATGLIPWHHARVRDNIPLMFYITTSSETPMVLPRDDNRVFSDGFIDFLDKCFERHAAKRPSAEELLQHPWITDASMIECMQREIEEVSLPQSVELCHTLSSEPLIDADVISNSSTPRLLDIGREPSYSYHSSSPGRQKDDGSPHLGLGLDSSLSGSVTVPGPMGLVAAAPPGGPGGNQYLLLNQEKGHLEFASCDDDSSPTDFPQFTFDEPPSEKQSPKSGARSLVRRSVSFLSNDLAESPGSGNLSTPHVALDGPVRMSFSFHTGGETVSVGLDIQPEDVTCRMVDRKPSFVVAMNEHIRGQLANAMTEFSHKISSASEEPDDD
jgi:serine/threonine protein kinase